MLTIDIVIKEGFDEEKNEFIPMETDTIHLEHSLVSLSKWESKWEKAFLDSSYDKTREMTIDYIRCMLLDGSTSDNFHHLSSTQYTQIQEYIDSKQTAAFINDVQQKGPGKQSKIITADIIYYWMVAMTIPFECQHWHLNRLITLVRITELEGRDKKKMSGKENMSRHRAMVQARRAQSEGGS